MTYAARTGVSTAKSRAEIETMLQRAGAKSFAIGWDTRGASIVFELQSRRVKLVLPLPLPEEKQFTHDKRGRPRAKDSAGREWDVACRARWRALVLIIKAKLEAVSSGVAVFEQEFLAHIIMPDGQTVAEIVQPAIARSYATNATLLLGAGS